MVQEQFQVKIENPSVISILLTRMGLFLIILGLTTGNFTK